MVVVRHDLTTSPPTPVVRPEEAYGQGPRASPASGFFSLGDDPNGCAERCDATTHRPRPALPRLPRVGDPMVGGQDGGRRADLRHRNNCAPARLGDERSPALESGAPDKKQERGGAAPRASSAYKTGRDTCAFRLFGQMCGASRRNFGSMTAFQCSQL
jgi:hypothetical protein